MIEHTTSHVYHHHHHLSHHESSYSNLHGSNNSYSHALIKEEPNSFYYSNGYYLNDVVSYGHGDQSAFDERQQQQQMQATAANDVRCSLSNGLHPYESFDHLMCNPVHKSENVQSTEGTCSEDTTCSSFSISSAISSNDAHEITPSPSSPSSSLSSCSSSSPNKSFDPNNRSNSNPLEGTTQVQQMSPHQATLNISIGSPMKVPSPMVMSECVNSICDTKCVQDEIKRRRTKSPSLPDTCKKCGSHFDDDRLLVRHMKVDHYYMEVLHFTEVDPGDRQKRYDEWFKRQMNRTSLPKELNGQYFKPFKCDLCSRHYSYKGTLARHRLKRHNLATFIDGQLIEPSAAPSDKYLGSFTCDTCGFTAGTRKLFERHVLRKHFQGMQPYPCDQCTESFDRSDRLLWHRRQKHAKEPLFTCDKCGRSYRTKLVYERHLRLQHSGHQFKCKECPKVFKSYASFDYHRRKHKGVQGMKFICEFCGFRFWSNQNRRKHIDKCHSDGQIDHVAMEENTKKDWSKEASATRSTGGNGKCSNRKSPGPKEQKGKKETDVGQHLYNSQSVVTVNDCMASDVNDFSNITSVTMDNECQPSEGGHQQHHHFSTACGDHQSQGHNLDIHSGVANASATVRVACCTGVGGVGGDGSAGDGTTGNTNACHNGPSSSSSPSVNDEVVKRRVNLCNFAARDLSNAGPQITHPVRANHEQGNQLSPTSSSHTTSTSASTDSTTTATSPVNSCPVASPPCHYNVSHPPNSRPGSIHHSHCHPHPHPHHHSHHPHTDHLEQPLLQLNPGGAERMGQDCYTIRHPQAQNMSEAHLLASSLNVTHPHHQQQHQDHHHHVHQQQHLHHQQPQQHHQQHHVTHLQQHPHLQLGHHHQESQGQSLNHHLQPLYSPNIHLQGQGHPCHGGNNSVNSHSIGHGNLRGTIEGQENLHPMMNQITTQATQATRTSPSSSSSSSSPPSTMNRCKMCFECVYNMRSHLMSQHSVALEALDYFLDL